MLSMEEESLNMLELSVTEEEPILTEKTLRVLSINSDGHVTNIVLVSSLGVSKSNILKAETIGISNSALI
jgi:hypothetical protein